MVTEFILKCDDHTFRFEFETDTDKREHGVPYLSLMLDRLDDPDVSWEWEGFLSHEPLSFALSYNDEVDIRGILHLTKRLQEWEGDFVFGEIFYGLNCENHFEGVLVRY